MRRAPEPNPLEEIGALFSRFLKRDLLIFSFSMLRTFVFRNERNAREAKERRELEKSQKGN